MRNEHKKLVAERCRSLDVSSLKNMGYFEQSRSGDVTWTNAIGTVIASIGLSSSVNQSSFLIFEYTHCKSGESLSYKVELAQTDCNFGGVRHWFICPNCGRRVGKLYLPPQKEHFRCRHCYNLSYRSRNTKLNSPSSQIMYVLRTLSKAEELENQIRRWFYRDELTLKARRFLSLKRKAEYIYQL
jgi:hypothetical protein